MTTQSKNGMIDFGEKLKKMQRFKGEKYKNKLIMKE